MKNQSSQKSNNQNEFRDLFTGMTTSKSSGLIYLFATVLPSVLAFFVMIILAMLGVLQEGYDKTDWYVYMMYVLSPVSFAAQYKIGMFIRQSIMVNPAVLSVP